MVIRDEKLVTPCSFSALIKNSVVIGYVSKSRAISTNHSPFNESNTGALILLVSYSTIAVALELAL